MHRSARQREQQHCVGVAVQRSAAPAAAGRMDGGWIRRDRWASGARSRQVPWARAPAMGHASMVLLHAFAGRLPDDALSASASMLWLLWQHSLGTNNGCGDAQRRAHYVIELQRSKGQGIACRAMERAM